MATIPPSRTAGRAPGALRLTPAIAVLAMAASAAGVLLPGTYAQEAPAWAAQATGQDLVNLVLVYPGLLVLARAARRGSLPAYLAWLGLLGYTAYSYLLYAGYTRFSAMFPLYVAVLALSGWGLVAALLPLRPDVVATALRHAPMRRLAGSWLVLFGAGYAALELAVVAGAVLRGVPPASAVAAGLPTDPVLMLDLAFVLPGMAACGLLVRRGKAAALMLAVPALAFSTAMGVAVLNMLVVTGLRLPPFPTVVVAAFALLTTGHATVLARVVRAMHPGVRLPDAVEAPRRPSSEDMPAAPIRVP